MCQSFNYIICIRLTREKNIVPTIYPQFEPEASTSNDPQLSSTSQPDPAPLDDSISSRAQRAELRSMLRPDMYVFFWHETKSFGVNVNNINKCNKMPLSHECNDINWLILAFHQ